MSIIRKKYFLIVAAFLLLFSSTLLYAVPPWLHVDGNKIKDPDGNDVVLRGVSLPDLGFAEYYYHSPDMNAVGIIDAVTDESDAQGVSPGWYTKIIRIPIYPPETTSVPAPYYWNPSNPDNFYDNYLRPAVDYCAEKGLYVIIDWHHIANTYEEVADTTTFWTYMAPKFAGDSHVLFELFNEPINQNNYWTSVRADMQTWVDIVRTYASDNLILVGTPNWCQVLGPVVANPIDGDNIVYVAHVYPAHWYGGIWQIDIDAIAACAEVYPVIVTEWGFMDTSDYDLRMFDGSASAYGRPFKAFLEQYGISNTAWCATYNWNSPMFYGNWTLRCGEYQMGCFVKDWLYEKSGLTDMADLTITKCTVKAGKTQGVDCFEASGTFPAMPVFLSSVTDMDVNIVSEANEVIYSENLDFLVSNLANSMFSYSYKIPRGAGGAITSLKIDFINKTFAIKAKNIDLTGLGCPLRVDLAFGNYILSGDANEAIVNKGKIIPTRLMRLYDDKLVVTKATARHSSTRAASDSLSVKGEIAIGNMDLDANEPNLVVEDVNITWGDGDTNQTFTITGDDITHSFKLSKKGHVYTCKGVDANTTDANTDQVSAKFDLDKCTFTVSIKKANSIYVGPSSGYAKFGINFAIPGHDDFNEVVDVNLATRRSY